MSTVNVTMNDQKRGREDEEDQHAEDPEAEEDEQETKTKRPKHEGKFVLEDPEAEDGQAIKAFVAEHAAEYAGVVDVDEALIPRFVEAAQKFVRKQKLTPRRLHEIEAMCKWAEWKDAMGRKFGTTKEAEAMYALLDAFRWKHAGNFEAVPQSLTEDELRAIGPNGNQKQVAEAVRLIMGRENPSRMKLACMAEQWIQLDATDNRLCVVLLVQLYKRMHAMVEGRTWRPDVAREAFQRHLEGRLTGTGVLRTGNSNMTDGEQAEVCGALYKLGGLLLAENVEHFGAIEPEAPYVFKYVRPDGPDGPVLLDRAFVDRIAKAAKEAGIVKRQFVVSRYVEHPYGGEGDDEDRTETISLQDGSPLLAELDKMIAAKKATRAECRYQPSNPGYEPSSPCFT
jgi:hypothetical protein